jgi:microcystin-dependent protein
VAISLKHKFTSAKSDGGDLTRVQPSNWNDEHDIILATARLLGRTSPGDGDAEEISVGSGLSLAAGILNTSFSELPVGVVMDYAKNGVAPAKWLLCDGAAVSRTTYAALYAAIGTVFGAGNGVTTFNVPDCRGRVIAGLDGGTNRLLSTLTGGVDGTTFAAVGGDDGHTLTSAQMPSHGHGIVGSISVSGTISGTTSGFTGGVTAQHVHQYTSQSINIAKVVGSEGSASAASNSWQAYSTGAESNDHAHFYNGSVSGTFSGSGNSNTLTIASTGGGAQHNNVQPTIVMSKIIYAGV